MSHVGAGLVIAWIIGGLFFVALYMNDLRRVYNNFVPGALQAAPFERLGSNHGWRFRFWRIDPALLTGAGRVYRQSAVLHERLGLAWGVCGFAGLVGYFSFAGTS